MRETTAHASFMESETALARLRSGGGSRTTTGSGETPGTRTTRSPFWGKSIATAVGTIAERVSGDGYQHNRYCRTLIFNPYFLLMSDTFVGIK